VCISSSSFIAHLVNQSVAGELVGLQIPILLLERPTDDSIEICVGFMREVGAFLAENVADGNNLIFDRLRAVLNEATISQRVQYMIEVLMQQRKDRYKDNPIMPEGLDLVEDEEIITHSDILLEGDLAVQDGLSECRFRLTSLRILIVAVDVFKFDPNFLENEEKYKKLKAEILGEDSDSDASGSGSEESEEEEEPGMYSYTTTPI
jgi:pre-mRNA-splicing factor CWC22